MRTQLLIEHQRVEKMLTKGINELSNQNTVDLQFVNFVHKLNAFFKQVVEMKREQFK